MEAKGHGCGGPREGLSVRAGRGWEQGAGQAGGARPETLMTVPQTSGHEALKDETSSSCRNVRTTAKLVERENGGPRAAGPSCGAVRALAGGRLGSVLPASVPHHTSLRNASHRDEARPGALQKAPRPFSRGFIFSPEKWEMSKFGSPKQKMCGFLK